MTKRICNLCTKGEMTEVLRFNNLSLGFLSNINEQVWNDDYILDKCPECCYIQTRINFPEELLLKENFYVSKYQAIQEHDLLFVKDVVKRTNLSHYDGILEIGSGDGILLNTFFNNGFKNLMGVEPTTHKSQNTAIEIIPDFFSEETLAIINKKEFKPKLIYANYVVALIEDTNKFFKLICSLLQPGSFFYFEVPYVLELFRTSRYDGFAHIICNFITAKSIFYISQSFGFDVEYIELDKGYRGGTLKVLLSKKVKSSSTENPINSQLRELIEKEDSCLYEDMTKDFLKHKEKAAALISKKAKDFSLIVLYGAGVKAATLFNILSLNKFKIDYAVDSDSNKQGLYFSGTDIRVYPLSKLFSENKSCLVINFALDHTKEITNLLASNCKGPYEIIDLFNCSV
jgi:novobiocin biosynthesis protein NovU/D-mycarose 3-C-methyltransferase